MSGVTRRDASRALLAGSAALAAPWALAQEAFASKALRVVIPTTPGGNLDVVGRVVAERMSEALGQPVLVENRTGASGSIAARFVGQSPPDGYTLLVVSNTFASTPATMTGAGYDPVRDFTGVTLLSRLPLLLVVPPDSPYKNLQELIAAAKARPGQVTYASAGAGSVARFAAERFARQAGVTFTHVPYKGNGEALVDMLAGRVDLFFDTISTSMTYVKGGKLRALAVTSSKRAEVLPAVPTMQEGGLKDFEDAAWVGLLMPSATPKATAAKLNAVVSKIVQSPDIRVKFAAQGQEMVGNSSEEFTAFIHSEVVRLAKLAQDANIRAD